jgi:N-acetylmuramic acid 6-phosphate etherase
MAAQRLRAGGRLFYVGAGTSGRLGFLDAAECPPTFGSDPGQVQAILAGGTEALLGAVEGAEDDREAARAAILRCDVGPHDLVIGISAGGTTPFVLAALAAARGRGAGTVLLACVGPEHAPAEVDLEIRLATGSELIAGSTRLKAGTATKIVLNTISSLTMVQLGKVHGNLMVDVNTRSNVKLVDRGERLVVQLAAVDRAAARRLLEAAGGRVKVAVVMARHGVGPEEASSRLQAAGGRLRQALA